MPGVQARHERGSRGRTHRRARVALREANAFNGHAIQMRRANALLAVTPDIAVAQVIRENENNVRPALGLGSAVELGLTSGAAS